MTNAMDEMIRGRVRRRAPVTPTVESVLADIASVVTALAPEDLPDFQSKVLELLLDPERPEQPAGSGGAS
jgi:hypothetical protein